MLEVENNILGNKRELLVRSASLRGAVMLFCLALIGGCVVSPAYAAACPAGGDHTYEVVVGQYATETEDGVRVFTCTKCGDSYQQSIPATGHQWGPWIVDVEATCTTAGHQYRECDQYTGTPHVEEQIIAPYSATRTHSYAVADEKPATCTEEGQILYQCTICGDTYMETTSARGHQWGSWETTEESTSNKEGVERKVCLNDANHNETRTLPLVEVTEEKKTPEKTEEEESVSEPVSRTSPTKVVPEPEVPSLFLSGPNAFDAVILVVDFAVLIAAAVLILPFFYQVLWLKKKRAEGRENYRKQLREEKGGSRA